MADGSFLTGLPAIYGADIYEIGTRKQFPLGAIGYAFGGYKAFRYGKNNASTAAVAGTLQIASAAIANHVNLSVAETTSINSRSVKVTLGATSASKDLYEDGELLVNNAAGGISYRIAGNETIASSGSGKINLAEPIQVDLSTSTSKVSLLKNMYDGFLISATSNVGLVVGVSLKAIPVSNYGWLQTRGICPLLSSEDTSPNIDLIISTSVAGAAQVDSGASFASTFQASVDTEKRAVYLRID